MAVLDTKLPYRDSAHMSREELCQKRESGNGGHGPAHTLYDSHKNG